MSRQIINLDKQYILIVDDNIYNIMALKSLLSIYNYFKIFTAENGQKALDLVLRKAQNNKYFRLIFTDIQMPIMDGYELIRQLRENEQLNILPKQTIIVLTADDME